MEHLFVYGTLLNHFKNDTLLAVEKFLKFKSNGYLKGNLYDLGEYPAVVEDAGTSEKVKGEIYLINNPEKVFDILDEYEGVNEVEPEYKRKKKVVTLSEGKKIKSWVYVYKKQLEPSLKKIVGGDYISFMKNRK